MLYTYNQNGELVLKNNHYVDSLNEFKIYKNKYSKENILTDEEYFRAQYYIFKSKYNYIKNFANNNNKSMDWYGVGSIKPIWVFPNSSNIIARLKINLDKSFLDALKSSLKLKNPDLFVIAIFFDRLINIITEINTGENISEDDMLELGGIIVGAIQKVTSHCSYIDNLCEKLNSENKEFNFYCIFSPSEIKKVKSKEIIFDICAERKIII